MRLQNPSENYVRLNEVERNRQIEAADRENHKRNRDVEIGEGRLILTDESTGRRYQIFMDYGALTVREVGGNEVSSDFDIRQAEAVVLSTYGDTVSVAAKGKNLNKFGRTLNADADVRTTVALFQGSEVNETFVSTNLIDSIVSDAAADTSLTYTIEGHTIDGSGNLTFVSQDATTNASDGRTEVTLTTPLARAARMYLKNSGTFNSPQTAATGNIYVYDNTDGITAGVPNTAAATKLMLSAGATQSSKCATSISSTDYWFISGAEFSITGGGPASEVEFQLEIRDVANGGVWRPIGLEESLEAGAQVSGQVSFRPFLIVPKNHDVRMIAVSNANNTEVTADIQGYLAAVQ